MLILVIGVVVLWLMLGGLATMCGMFLAWYTDPKRRTKDGGMRWPQWRYGEGPDEEEDY